MISKSDYLILVALTLVGIENRKATQSAEDILAKQLHKCGINEEWAGELVYNEGDSAKAAVDRILESLELEVEE